ncbi:NAD(P)/FAD-dependent oxidoreductase [Microbacterium sp. C7(2022)]|uniref:phytoene desaturase family protein n=1 Tax=Microbacterium sp. C7(2022) TaxID=2992759 RepID=UPI00237C054A|nr:NAD(P)/FAD-dependent oxidoreductase [Microbacterium sp. C7(2022)]MDE0546123.1 NAD(P)/FAD-dependent oxidoreductase [Microbacterium sp. C7(2022)]
MLANTTAPVYDVAIIGGGHNALVAAAYLAREGVRTIVLERQAHVGGAAVSQHPWPGVDARLSRYSYLVSLLPRRIIDELGLDVTLLRRRYSSYTPDPSDPTRGILIDNADATATAASFARVAASPAEADRFAAFSRRIEPLARALFPTVTEPLRRASEIRQMLGDDALWCDVVEEPLGRMLHESFDDDITRGIALTDGLIGTFARSDDASLRQNRCFLYHVIGGGTGDWDVPVGGMGRVSAELERVAREAGAELRCGTEVTALRPALGTGDASEVCMGAEVVRARLVLSGVGPAVLERLVAAGCAGGAASANGGSSNLTPATVTPEGAQLKVNMLLTRLPRLRDASVSPEAAFAGTFHVNETLTQLDAAYDAAAGGGIPNPLPLEIYCHSLSDPSILGPELRDAGAHTLTLFALHVPHRLVKGKDPDAARDALLSAALRSLDAVLAEPIEGCLATAPDGSPCIEARTTADLEESLGMVGGDIFHGSLSWPWADDDEPLDTAARRWGVGTAHDGVLLCGSGARRGGAVSGIGGHNAAMAALEMLGD